MNIQGPRNPFIPLHSLGIILFLAVCTCQSTVLFNCTFDDGLFQSLLPLRGASLQITDGKGMGNKKIDQPLSDATSVGRYAYQTTSDGLGYLGIYRSARTINASSSGREQCLRFYYYFTDACRNSTITLRMHPTSNRSTSETIAAVRAKDDHEWHHHETSFIPVADEYYLILVLYREKDLDDTKMFTFAVDDISIISDACVFNTSEDVTTDSPEWNETLTYHTSSDEYTSSSTTLHPMESRAADSSIKATDTILFTTHPQVIPNNTNPTPASTPSTTSRETTFTSSISTTTKTTISTESTTVQGKNLGDILGLALAFGIPTLLLFILVVFFIVKVRASRSQVIRVKAVRISEFE